MPCRLAISLVLCLLGMVPAAQANLEGQIFLDTNANGLFDAEESPAPGVVITNGRDVTVAGPDGRYRLPIRAEGFTAITRPAGFHCEPCYRRGGGDFALSPSPSSSDDFFFVHMSDAHVYDDIKDFAEFSAPSMPGWMPNWIGAWLTLRFVDSRFPGLSYDEIVESLRNAVAPYREVSDASGPNVLLAYQAELARPGSPLSQIEPAIRSAFREVATLRPEFIIHTGDLVLEGNEATPEAMERWFPFYLDVARSTGLPFYETIGNNELAGTSRKDFPESDPRHGKYYFRKFLGPTHYSFDRGRFHFAATDTHRAIPGDDEHSVWEFGSMEPDVRDWLDADLEAHKEKTLIVLNHEPFRADPSWKFDESIMADDEGLLRRHAVAYSLAGHTHVNGLVESEGTTHITTGALSGYRWTLPSALSPRGYRLFYAKGNRLYSAWKNTGQPLLGFIEPKGDPKIHPASKTPTDPTEVGTSFDVVAVAADARGPFASVSLQRGGSPIPLVQWGDYFFAAHIDAGRGPLVLTAVTLSGQIQQAELSLGPQAADAGASAEP